MLRIFIIKSHESTKYTLFYLLIYCSGHIFSRKIWNWGMNEEKMSKVCVAVQKLYVFFFQISTGSPGSHMDYQGPAVANLSMTSKKWLKRNINTSKISARSSLYETARVQLGFALLLCLITPDGFFFLLWACLGRERESKKEEGGRGIAKICLNGSHPWQCTDLDYRK